ncbi:signal recognition particle, putative [Eimeria tenella]|uniref:Signal recognition particle subunit SRP68 n=1 Tax=Eimeria tenella TaxID=5802 RepID=H9B9L6_EIMTE|nr:signal recognition particle, putative [Eimeria tenella]AET50676.1 hypothetical protein [Eimeria tenella]CDJ43069.1 signal recognition particle, putative [Eimeria tenella]|eukprot:XP_013233819.1 signal recognition particle, putative [Eimeria tenella]
MAAGDLPASGGSGASPASPSAAAAAAAAAAPLALEITQTAHLLGEQNGLRHQDFCRYRKYLSRKLGRLRQQLDAKNGRHRYTPKPLPDNIQDERYLLLLLVQAERAWAYGMQLKSDNANSVTPNAKLRAHSIRRFAKAVSYAHQLEALCKGPRGAPKSSSEAPAAAAAGPAGEAADAAAPTAAAEEEERGPLCDGKTCLDALAYRCFMESVLQQEKEQWTAAANTLQQLQQVYVQLKHLSSTQPELEKLYKAKLEALDPLLRLCVFHSGDIRAAALQQQQQRAADRKKQAAAAAAAAADGSSSSGVATWRDAPVSPKKDKPRAAIAAALANWEQQQLLSVETLRAVAAAEAADIKAAAPALMERDAQGWAEQYGEASARFRGCVELIHRELMAEPEEVSWLQCQGFCMDMSRCLEVERDALMLLRCLLSLAATDADLKGGRELARAQEGFRFASLLLQGLERMQGEETLPEDRGPQLQRWVQVAKDSKATCLATAIACGGSLAEAFVLARAVSTRQVPLTLKPELAEDPHERIDLLLAAIYRVTAVAVGQRVCRYLCALLRQTQNLQSSAPCAATTREAMGESAETSVQKQLNSTVGRLLLPAAEPIACKPHLFDLAISSLKPPDLSKKTGTSTGRRLGGLLKSLWGR